LVKIFEASISAGEIDGYAIGFYDGNDEVLAIGKSKTGIDVAS
jgi:hypothetical protein